MNQIHDLGHNCKATMFQDGSLAIENNTTGFKVHLLPEKVEKLRKIFQSVEA